MAITNDNFCLTVMRELGEVAGQNGDPLRNRQVTGLLDALRSDSNTLGSEVETLERPGDKTRNVILKHLQPDSVADSSDAITNICTDTGVSSAWLYTDVALSREIQSATKILTSDQMRTLCEDDSTWRMKLIGQMLNSVHKLLNQSIITPFSLGTGGLLNGDGAQATSYQMLYRDGLLQIDPEGIIDMMRDLQDTGMVGLPIVVGGGNIKKYADLKGIACCNQFGSNPQDLSEFQLFYDNDLNTILTSPSDTGNSFYAFAPGAAQFLNVPQYVGARRRVTDESIRDTIVDPVSGIEWDFRASYDDCVAGGQWKLKLEMVWDLWQQPLTLFKAADDRYKINYNYWFNATEGVPTP